MKSMGNGLTAVFFLTAALLPLCAAGQGSAEPSEANEAHAVGCLRTINTAAVTYSATYHKGFSRTLVALGMTPDWKTPTASAAGLIDAKLTSGRHSGYLFTYKEGPVDDKGLTNTYTVSARPIKWHEGLRSFFTDQSGVIRGTEENRAATAKDPPIE